MTPFDASYDFLLMFNGYLATFLKQLTSEITMTLKSGTGVTQGHRK